MKDLQPIQPAHFLEAVQPYLEKNDLKGLLGFLKSKWMPSQIMALLSCKCCDTRKVAALSLALVGGRKCIDELIRQLKDPDPVINEMAEYALWSIWFRSGSVPANHELCRGTQALNRRDFDHAIEHFTHAIEIDPNFAEAYNQRAIVAYLQERYDDSTEDCKRATDLMPCHFGAWAGMGHCQAHLMNTEEAIRCYEKALEINPHLSCVTEALCELKRGR